MKDQLKLHLNKKMYVINVVEKQVNVVNVMEKE